MGIVLLVGVLAVWELFPSLFIPGSQVVSWKLDYGFGGPGFDPEAAQTTMIVPIEVSRPACAPDGDSWLEPPVIAYTPWSVTITMQMTDAISESPACAVLERNPSGLPVAGFYLSGTYYPVHLSEPLGGRALFDGDGFPPQARPYP
jgi:hypothetical protein